jgi:transitional endoplasmic reticulum ATPase
MTLNAAGERHKKSFEEYLALFEQSEADKDVSGMRHNLKRAIEYWTKYTESAESPTIQNSRMDNLETLADLYESLPKDASGLPDANGGPSKVVEGDAEETQKYSAVERPNLTFDDIAGLSEVKEEVKLKMLYPFSHPEEAARFRIKRGGGVLLWGPPGTGKTMMAKAIAGEIDAAFFTVKPSEVMSKWVGDSEQNIQALFNEARSHPISIIFIDEIDALIPARKGNETGGVMARLVPQILAELEGFDTASKNPLLFIGATNEPWSLDPAVMRPGRFDVKIYVGLPDLPARRKLLDIGFKGRPISKDVNLDDLAEGLEAYSGADITYLCENAAQDAFLRAVHKVEKEPVIGTEDILKALKETRPSVTPENLERFQEYRKRT